MEYMYETQKSTLEHITTITPYSTGQYMVIDTSTRRNLELVETMREKQKRGTLLWVLDKTKTAMGARLLRNYIEQPLIHKNEILRRQDAVEELNMNYISREEICEYLNPVYDLERLIGRISYKTANPRDLLAFKTSLEMLPYIKKLLGEFQSDLLKELETLYAKSGNQLCVLYGRPDLEKELLLKTFLQNKKAFYYRARYASPESQKQMMAEALEEKLQVRLQKYDYE